MLNDYHSFISVNTQQLLAVPFAFHAKTTSQEFELSNLSDVDTTGIAWNSSPPDLVPKNKIKNVQARIQGHFRDQVKDPEGLRPGTCRKSRCAPCGTIPGVQNPKIWPQNPKNVGFAGFPGRKNKEYSTKSGRLIANPVCANPLCDLSNQPQAKLS